MAKQLPGVAAALARAEELLEITVAALLGIGASSTENMYRVIMELTEYKTEHKVQGGAGFLSVLLCILCIALHQDVSPHVSSP